MIVTVGLLNALRSGNSLLALVSRIAKSKPLLWLLGTLLSCFHFVSEIVERFCFVFVQWLCFATLLDDFDTASAYVFSGDNVSLSIFQNIVSSAV